MTAVKFEEAGVIEGRPVSASYPLPVRVIETASPATSPNKTEDTQHTTADVGTAMMAVQTASPADAASANDYAMLQMKDGRLWTRQMDGLTASASFTPAAAEYTAGDIYGAAATFALGAPSACTFMIRSLTFIIAGGTVETTVWRLHLFSITPPSALADNAAFVLASGDRASYLGYITIPQVVDLTDTLWIEVNNINKAVKLAGTGLFGYLVAESTITPAAVAHTVTLIGEPV